MKVLQTSLNKNIDNPKIDKVWLTMFHLWKIPDNIIVDINEPIEIKMKIILVKSE